MDNQFGGIASVDDLVTRLRGHSGRTPDCAKGPTKADVERRTFCRLIATLISKNKLAFPLNVCIRERPDFQLTCGTTTIGVEITQATSENFEKALALQAREFPNGLVEVAQFSRGSPRHSTSQIRSMLRSRVLTSDGWAGDGMEQDWAAFVEAAVRNKLSKLRDAEFQKYDLNWLAIYYNFETLLLDLNHALRLLEKRIGDFWNENPSFDAIYIETPTASKSQLNTITRQAIDSYAVSDVWST